MSIPDEYMYVKMPSEPQQLRTVWIFDELPKAVIVSVSRPDVSDITPMLLSYTIEFHYKEFKWCLTKKASQVLYLHFALKKRAFIEEFHEKQGQVKEWIQNLGLLDHTPVVHDEEADDVAVKKRNVPSSAALPVIKPALGTPESVSDRAKVAMQGYLNHFFSNLDIANSKEVCRFLEVSRLSFLPEYGPKLKEDYVSIKHLPKFRTENDANCGCTFFSCCCNSNWQKVWAVLKPGFLALLKDPFDTKPLDIIIFDMLPISDNKSDERAPLAVEIKEKNPLRFGFQVSSGSRTIKIRSRTSSKVKDWVGAINEAALRPREGWCNPHRFGSFAPMRGLGEEEDEGSYVQWFVDGEAGFGAIADSIEGAKSEIFITDWWLCPELYLKRPFNSNSSSRLEALLEARAKQGVQIYILLYKEVALALKINSMYSKKRLLNIHENVKVLRYPDHFPTGIYYWSHHEKIVVVDNQICYIGGLDLCFGRYDNPEHKVGDSPAVIWPGKDYYNPRESEPNSWEDTLKDEIDRENIPRMPWHDVQCALWGPPCRDVARHFVQRWNYAKRNKAPNEQTIPLLMPQYHMVIPHYLGKSIHQSDHSEAKPDQNGKVVNKPNSLQDIPLLLPKEPLSLTPIPERTNQKLPPVSVFNKKKKRRCEELAMEGFVDEREKEKVEFEFEREEEREEEEREWSEVGQVGPRTACRCQVIRSVGNWSAGTSQTEESIHNAYCSLIEKSEHFIYIENQFFISGLERDDTIKNRVLEALYRRIIKAHNENKCFRVIIVIPLLPGFQGGIDDFGAASVRAIMHWQYRTICRGSNSILHNLYTKIGNKAQDYISFYGLRTYGKLSDSRPLVTNQIYVHSKLMIVDDRIALIGSANINDRSLLGSRDSEIGVVIEDKEFVDSKMEGREWKAGKFNLSLRLSLWCEHLGLRAGQRSQIIDPIDDATYKNIWMETAQTNTMVYQDVFSCVPNDLICSRYAFRQSINQLKEKIGHNTIDLGVASQRTEANKNGEITNFINPIEKLQSIKGRVVCFPLEFMSQEDLRPFFGESEFYVAPHVFH